MGLFFVWKGTVTQIWGPVNQLEERVAGVKMVLTMAAIIGINIVQVAELLVTSVSIATRKHTMIIMSHPGKLPNTDNWSPIHCDRPDA